MNCYFIWHKITKFSYLPSILNLANHGSVADVIIYPYTLLHKYKQIEEKYYLYF